MLPLVGSTIVAPGLSNPLFSASQIMAAPIRHLTEYDGLRPSTLASTVAPEPPVIRFSFTNGVCPMDCELSSKYLGMVSFPFCEPIWLRLMMIVRTHISP